MRIFSAIRILENRSSYKFLSCKGEIITFLFENGPSRPKEIIENCRHTNVAVFVSLDDLCKCGILEKNTVKSSNITYYFFTNDYLERVYCDGLPL